MATDRSEYGRIMLKYSNLLSVHTYQTSVN